MTGIDFNHGYDFFTIKRHFEDLFLKFKSQNGNIGFSDLEKVKFQTKLYERCDHSAVSSLNETLKNAISEGNIQTWDQATKPFENQESELKQRAADMIQAEQLLIQYKKQPSQRLKMYPATVNALTHETQLASVQAKKSTINLINNDINYNASFFGKCHTCGKIGHRSINCPFRHNGDFRYDYPNCDRSPPVSPLGISRCFTCFTASHSTKSAWSMYSPRDWVGASSRARRSHSRFIKATSLLSEMYFLALTVFVSLSFCPFEFNCFYNF